MARIKIRDGGDQNEVLDYLSPVVGVQAVTGATATGYGTVTVAVASILATDIVLTQLESCSSVGAKVTDVVITAGTGFQTTIQGPSAGTLAYVVFHANK